MDKGILSVFPSSINLIGLSPWLSNICEPFFEIKKFTKEIAPSVFLTVFGIVIENSTGSP